MLAIIILIPLFFQRFLLSFRRKLWIGIQISYVCSSQLPNPGNLSYSVVPLISIFPTGRLVLHNFRDRLTRSHVRSLPQQRCWRRRRTWGVDSLSWDFTLLCISLWVYENTFTDVRKRKLLRSAARDCRVHHDSGNFAQSRPPDCRNLCRAAVVSYCAFHDPTASSMSSSTWPNWECFSSILESESYVFW